MTGRARSDSATAAAVDMRPHTYAVCVLFGFKFLQFCDRSVINGSPSEIQAFILQTTGSHDSQATLFAALASVYSVGNIVACCAAVALLASGMSIVRSLLVLGVGSWTTGVFFSAACYWLPVTQQDSDPRRLLRQ